ncbi:hypothetical protein Tco_0581682 [Tanacetum coccineum]
MSSINHSIVFLDQCLKIAPSTSLAMGLVHCIDEHNREHAERLKISRENPSRETIVIRFLASLSSIWSLDLVESSCHKLRFCSDTKFRVNTLDIGEFPADGSLVDCTPLIQSLANYDWKVQPFVFFKDIEILPHMGRALRVGDSGYQTIVQSLTEWRCEVSICSKLSSDSGDSEKISMNFKAKGSSFLSRTFALGYPRWICNIGDSPEVGSRFRTNFSNNAFASVMLRTIGLAFVDALSNQRAFCPKSCHLRTECFKES